MEDINEVLFVPNSYYIQLLKEFHYFTYAGKPGKLTRSEMKTKEVVRAELAKIEVGMPSFDIIKNTKIAFEN
jgi:hypothetical protein